jgi:hypothetical protein
VKWYIQSIDFYGVENYALRKEDEKYPDCFEMWCWINMEKIHWNSRVKSEVLRRAKEERNILKTTDIKEG